MAAFMIIVTKSCMDLSSNSGRRHTTRPPAGARIYRAAVSLRIPVTFLSLAAGSAVSIARAVR